MDALRTEIASQEKIDAEKDGSGPILAKQRSSKQPVEVSFFPGVSHQSPLPPLFLKIFSKSILSIVLLLQSSAVLAPAF